MGSLVLITVHNDVLQICCKQYGMVPVPVPGMVLLLPAGTRYSTYTRCSMLLFSASYSFIHCSSHNAATIAHPRNYRPAFSSKLFIRKQIFISFNFQHSIQLITFKHSTDHFQASSIIHLLIHSSTSRLARLFIYIFKSTY